MEDDDDDYGSDEFDSLPPGTLYELERKAFQATQTSAAQYQYHAQPISSHLGLRAQTAQPNNNDGSFRPPPRLHTGLTNDYNTLEVGELEAEVYDNIDGHHIFQHGHHRIATDSRLAADEQLGDAMEVDEYHGQEYYGQGNSTGINARLVQVCWVEIIC